MQDLHQPCSPQVSEPPQVFLGLALSRPERKGKDVCVCVCVCGVCVCVCEGGYRISTLRAGFVSSRRG